MKIKFTREQMLRLNTQDCQTPLIEIPEEIKTNKRPSMDALFSNRIATSCKPIKDPAFFDDRADPSSPAICI